MHCTVQWLVLGNVQKLERRPPASPSPIGAGPTVRWRGPDLWLAEPRVRWLQGGLWLVAGLGGNNIKELPDRLAVTGVEWARTVTARILHSYKLNGKEKFGSVSTSVEWWSCSDLWNVFVETLQWYFGQIQWYFGLIQWYLGQIQMNSCFH